MAEAPPPTAAEPRKRRRWPLLIALTFFAVVAGLFGYAYLSRLPPQVQPAQVVEMAPMVAEPSAPAVSIVDAETKAQTLVAGLSPELSKLLGADVLRRVVAAVQLASEGQSWLHLFPALRPAAEMEVVSGEIAAQSYGRYDAVTAMISAVDPTALAAAYVAVKPALAQLFEEVAPPGAVFDDALAKALSPVIQAKISSAPVEVVPKGLVFAFKDPALEAMDPTSKLMMRVGPTNALRLQTTAKAFAAAAKLP